jgi:hypothetical protein
MLANLKCKHYYQKRGASMSEEITGKAKGGFARAEVLSPEKRKEIATNAASARWSTALPKTLGQGTLKIAGSEIPCAVIDGEIRVLNQAGFLRAIGRARSPKSGTGVLTTVDDLPFFLQAEALGPFISEELKQSTKAIFYDGGTSRMVGYDARLLPQVCEVYLKYRDNCLSTGKAVPKRYEHIVLACDILMRGLAHIGIIALVDEATGYQEVRPKDALQAYLEKIVAKELAAWAKKFPDEFYENIYKLKNWPWPGMSKNRYSVVAHYTNDLVYERIAPGLRKALEEKNPKNEKGWRPAKNHQWLTAEIGDPMLAQHLYSLVMFQRLAISSGFGWNRFVKMVDRVHPRKGATLELPFPEEEG